MRGIYPHKKNRVAACAGTRFDQYQVKPPDGSGVFPLVVVTTAGTGFSV